MVKAARMLMEILTSVMSLKSDQARLTLFAPIEFPIVVVAASMIPVERP